MKCLSVIREPRREGLGPLGLSSHEKKWKLFTAVMRREFRPSLLTLWSIHTKEPNSYEYLIEKSHYL